MKLYDIDWADFLDRAELLEEIDPRTLAIFFELKPQVHVARESFGDDLQLLVRKKVLHVTTGSGKVRLHEEFREASKALRAMARFPIWADSTPAVYREYLSANFTAEEREVLAGESVMYYYHRHDFRVQLSLISIGHLRGFMEAADPAEWEQDRVVERVPHRQQQSGVDPLLDDAQTAADTRALLEVLAARSEPVPIAQLRAELGRRSKVRIGKAILAAVRYVLAFPTLHPGTLAPSLTLWPEVAERWNRTPTKMPEAIDPDSVVETFDTPWGLEDVTQLLVAASEPIRLRSNDRGLFAKAQGEVEASLFTLPDLVGQGDDTSSLLPMRVSQARELALRRGLLDEVGTSGKSLRLELTDEGRTWLALSPRERLTRLIEPMRAPKEGEAEEEEEDVEEMGNWWEEGLRYRDFVHSRRNEFLPTHYHYSTLSSRLSSALVEAMSRLDCGHIVPRSQFISHLVDDASPLRGESAVRAFQVWHGGGPLSEEALDESWMNLLAVFLRERFMRFGAVRTGRTGEGLFTIELTEIGRWLLRLTDELEYSAGAREERPVRVQPDFEVVFLAPSPALEASIVRFAERLGTGVGTLFKITAASIHAAANAGLSLEETLSALRDACATALPRNVEHEIRVWFEESCRLPLEPALVVRCPDEEIAARLRSAAGRRADFIPPTTLVIDPNKRNEVVRLCKKAGIFLEGGEPEPKKKKKRRRRRRYW